MIKLNLGCGYNKKENFINVDSDRNVEPDLVHDLETTWPWEKDSVSEVYFEHSLDRIGKTVEQYYFVMRELYRVCKNGAKVFITVPHPRHDNFLKDPEIRRAIIPQSLLLFNLQHNLQQIGKGIFETHLGLQLGVNFQIVTQKYFLEEDIHKALTEKKVSEQQVQEMLRFQNNVCREIEIEIEVVKTPEKN